MDDTARIAHARETVEAYNTGDWDRWRELHAPDVVYDEVATGRRLTGHDEVLDALRSWRGAFPDGGGEVAGTAVQGDTVVLEITWTGTQTGEMITPAGTIPPSGRHQTTRACMVIEFSGDTIVANRHYFDTMSLLQQLGALPGEQSMEAGA